MLKSRNVLLTDLQLVGALQLRLLAFAINMPMEEVQHGCLHQHGLNACNCMQLLTGTCAMVVR